MKEICTASVAYASKKRPSFNQFFFHFQSYWLLFLGSVSVGELVSVDDALRDQDKYPHMPVVSGLMESSFDGT